MYATGSAFLISLTIFLSVALSQTWNISWNPIPVFQFSNIGKGFFFSSLVGTVSLIFF